MDKNKLIEALETALAALKQPAVTFTPPTRESLSDEAIAKLWANKSPANEFECVRLVEKEHGIGE